MRSAVRLMAALLVLAGGHALAAALPVADVTVYTTHGEVPLKLEVAATPEARIHGLMQRDTLKPYDGMLFLFPQAYDYTFWMKNTMIPLDMLFVCDKHNIAHIEENVAPYTTAERSSGRDDIIAVIELDGGRASREGIAVKDHVRYELPKGTAIR